MQITNHQSPAVRHHAVTPRERIGEALLPEMAEALREFLSAWNQEEFAFLPLEKSARRATDVLARYDAAVKP